MSSTTTIYDFVIVGGGTSGAVVAGNLARTQQRPRVLVIETGGNNQRPDLRVASERYVNPIKNPEISTKFQTTPQFNLKGRILDYLTGRGLGGSSIANFLAYIRGSASDYDEWASRVGDKFFAWNDALQRFKEVENLHFAGAGAEDEFVKLKENTHGFNGPLDISLPSRQDWEVGQDKLLQAAIQFGWPACKDQNSGNPIGIGCTTTTSYAGYRVTSGSAYLDKAPSNLDIWCHATATKILLETNPHSKRRAVGVELDDGRVARASKELILSAGAIGTPRLLLLSGIGPENELKDLNIDCMVHHSSVGKNMMDHIWTTLHWSVSPELSDAASYSADKLGAILSREEWTRSRTGPDAYRNLSNFISFIKFHPERAKLTERDKLPASIQRWIKQPNVPEIEIFIKARCPDDWNLAENGEFMGLTIMLMNPQSRGQVRLASKDPLADCIVDPDYLSHPYDRQTLINGVREALAYVRSTSLSQYVRKEMLVPATDNDEDILSFCQQTVDSVLHGCGTVRMGSKSDTTACLDPHFRVRGVENLRVIDLSAAPLITNNHTMATAFVVGQFGFKRLADEYGLFLHDTGKGSL